MFKKTLIAVTLATACLASAQAAGVDKPTQVTVSAGTYDHKATGFKSDDANGFGILGAYRASPSFAAELGYYKYSDADLVSADSTISVDSTVTAVQVGIKGVYPVSSFFEVYTRFGAARWKLRDFDDETGIDFYFGLGGEAIIRESIIFGLAYNQFTADADGGNYKIGGIELNMGFRF